MTTPGLYFGVVLFLSTPITSCCATPVRGKHQAQPSAVAYWYQSNLAQEAESLQQKMLSLFNISYDAWQIYKNSKEAFYQQACEQLNKDRVHSAFYAPMSERTLALAQQLIDERGLSSRNIKLLGSFDEVESDQCTLYIADFYLRSTCPLDAAGLPDKVAVQAIILHELMHIQNDDQFTYFCMTQFVQEHPATVDPRMWHEYKGYYNYFKEQRADLQAGLVDINYARASARFFYDYLQKYGEQTPEQRTGAHPLMADRYEYLQQLVEYMEAEECGGIMVQLFCAVKRGLGVW